MDITYCDNRIHVKNCVWMGATASNIYAISLRMAFNNNLGYCKITLTNKIGIS